MNRFALIGATFAVLVCAAVVAAASPLPSSSPSASPMASPYASATPNTSSGTANQNAQPQTWTSDVNPVDIAGTATLTKNADGTGLLVLQLTGMVNNENWIVDVDPGTIQHPNDGVDIAYKTGSDVQKIAPDKIQAHLSKDEMDAFTKALNENGVTIFVSDGHRLSAATLTGTQQ